MIDHTRGLYKLILQLNKNLQNVVGTKDNIFSLDDYLLCDQETLQQMEWEGLQGKNLWMQFDCHLKTICD